MAVGSVGSVVPAVGRPGAADEAADGDGRVREVEGGINDRHPAFVAAGEPVKGIVPGVGALDRPSRPGSAKTLSVRGVVHLTIVGGVVPDYLAAARQNFDAEYAAEFERNCRAMYDQMARIAVEPQWARFYDFGAGRMPQFLAELAKKSSRLVATETGDGNLANYLWDGSRVRIVSRAGLREADAELADDRTAGLAAVEEPGRGRAGEDGMAATNRDLLKHQVSGRFGQVDRNVVEPDADRSACLLDVIDVSREIAEGHWA